MNDSPNRWRAIATFTFLALALSFGLVGCSSKTSPTPAAQAPPAAPGANSATAANSVPGNPANPAPAKPAPAPRPALILPRGTRLLVRLNQTIDVKHAESGDRFSGVLAEPVVEGNTVAVPSGSPASGEVLVAHKRGHFKGASVLQLRLTSMTLNGTNYPLDTSSLTRTKKGKGKRSAAFIGGTSGLGMLIGGVATGGTGLLIGGLAGAGAGTAAAGLTGNRDIDIPAESIVHFKLADDLVVQPS